MKTNAMIAPQAVAVPQTVTAKEGGKSSKIGGYIVNGLLILLILVGIFCSFTAFVTKSGSGVPSLFGIRPFSVQTGSMEPTFYAGDLIVDTTVKDYDSLKVGDVITFWTVIQGERALNTHRIIAIEDCGTYYSFTTRGDNNSMEDALTVHQSEIVGIYKFRIPRVGSFLDFLQTSKGFLIVIVIPCALFFIYELINFFKALFAFQAEKVRLQYQAAPQQDAAPGKEPEIVSAPETPRDA